jgi:hypothetical protein
MWYRETIEQIASDQFDAGSANPVIRSTEPGPR